MFILFILLIIAVVIFGTKKYGFIDKFMKTESDSILKNVPKIKNADEAISYAKRSGEAAGYKNAFSELTEKNTSSIDGDHYYRMQQNYKGIPVYGRDAIYVTDKENNVIIITGNAQDIEGDVQLSPAVTEEEVCNSIVEYVKNNLTTEDWEGVSIEKLQKEDLCIYDFSEDGKSRLAYQIWKNGYVFIVDANNAEILSANQTVCSVTGYTASDVKRENGFEVKQIDQGYVLDDEDILWVSDLEGVNSKKNGKIDFQKIYENQIISPDIIFGNDAGEEGYEEGIRYYLNVIKIKKMLNQMCNFKNKFLICYNDGYNWGRNAYGGSVANITDTGEVIGILSMGKHTGIDDIDVIAHEYAHFISGVAVGWNGGGIENSAINEGISDVYGTIAEAYYFEKNEPTWYIKGDNINVKRDMSNPHKTQNAASVDDSSWLGKQQGKNYYYSTVISHASYLMWNGINDEDTERISPENIVKLWYRAMLMMPADCDFVTCREKVEWAAVTMKFTEKQKSCISKAFDEVGIEKREVNKTELILECDKNVRPGSVLEVFDKYGKTYSKYMLKITGTIAEQQLGYTDTIITDLDMFRRFESSIQVNEEKIYLNDVPNGYYTFTVTDVKNTEDKYTFTVSISDAGTEESIELYTNFESFEVQETDVNEKDAYEIYKRAVQKNISSGNWREEVTLTGDMNLVSSDKREKMKTKAALEATSSVENYDEKDLSKLKISGDGNIQAAGQNLAWTVDYADGVAHYQYTEPANYTNDVAIDPICFQFNVLTREMMQDASISGNTIRFTVSGDEMAQVASETMNMINGIENLELGDGTVKILIDEEAGTISGMNMTFHASMEYMGYQADVDYDIQYQFIPLAASADSETGTVYSQFDKSKVPEGAGEYNGHYYYAYNLDTITNWEEAKQYCEEMGGYLATVTSREEDEFLYAYLQNTFQYENAYFGFTDREEEGNWKWSNGEEGSYTNWHEGEPNAESAEENFAMYYYKYPEGTWNDGDFGGGTVNSGTVFICEWGEF